MLKERDFVEIEYTGKLEDGTIFDTNSSSDAKKLGIKDNVEPAIVCIGNNFLLPALDASLKGKEIGAEYEIRLLPEQAFGKRNAKLIRMISLRTFTRQNIQPEQGLQVQIAGHVGVVKSANSGRIIVDFNHPLSGKEVTFRVKILRNVDKSEEKIKAMIYHILPNAHISIDDGVATIKSKLEITKEMQEEIRKRVLDYVTEIKEVKMTTEK